MKNAYSYGCVRDYCEKVSVEFGVDLLHVIPVSNYFEEVASNDAKMRCLSLISGVSLNLGKNTLNDAGTEKKLVFLKKAENGHLNNFEEME